MRSSWIICVCLKSNDTVLTDDAGRDQKILGRWGGGGRTTGVSQSQTKQNWMELERTRKESPLQAPGAQREPCWDPDFTLRTSTTVIGFIAGTRSHEFALGNQ